MKEVFSLRVLLSLPALAAAFLVLTIFPSISMAAVWSSQPGVTTNRLFSIKFVDQNHGWAVGDSGTILATTNGGASWSVQPSGTTSLLYGVSFVDKSHGWAAGAGGTILATTNGGASWSVQPSGTTTDLYRVFFLDLNHGWAVGYNGTILATTNGGASWGVQPSGTTNWLADVIFTDRNHGWAVGTGGTILATTNGGASWSVQPSGTTNTLVGASFVDQNHGWAVGGGVALGGGSGGGTILATSNGGATWIPQANGWVYRFDGVCFTDQNHGWAVGDSGTILATTNGGASWSVQPSGTTNSLFSVKFVDQSHGWAAGAGGAIVAYSPNTSYWTWYDNVGGSNWVLMANPAGAANNLTYKLSIGGKAMSLPGGGVVTPGHSITPVYPGVMGGPVVATRTSAGSGILSQRSLWPKGGSSMEEVPATNQGRLSNHFYWTWYDQNSPGMTNWVLVANPGVDHNGNSQGAVSAMVKVAGVPVWSGSIAPGANITPTFPGRMGGPVEVISSGGDVLASQRVLSGGGSAFNEVPGIPAAELSDHYLWTWYDNASAGATDWVLIANPNATAVTAHIKIAGALHWSGNIAPGGKVTPTFPGVMGGPVEVWTDSGSPVIATQRSLFGPSFEEVPGLAASKVPGGYSALLSDYNWTWYDQNSPGMTNWVLVANPGYNHAGQAQGAVTAHIKVAGADRWDVTIGPGQSATHTFPGLMGGPVEVTTNNSGDLMASQRVLYNGYFNEVLGTPLQ